MPNAITLHSRTPVLAVIDPRGLGIRNVTYHRTTEDAVPDPRIQRSRCNARGQEEIHWDPRLWKQFQEDGSSPPNGIKVWSLSGKPLYVRNVDSGWRVTVFAETDVPAQIWDGRRTTMRYVFDDLLRPVATYERMEGFVERCVECFVYGAADATGNRRGMLIRHDDTAGTKTATEFSLGGAPLDDTRRFLATIDVPDWPEDMTEREAMLEAEAWTTHRRYNPLGEVIVHTDARGNTQRSVRGIDGTLAQVWLRLPGGGERCLLRELFFDAEGAPIRQVDGNGIARQWEFAAMDHRLMSSSVQRGGDMLQDLSYVYDAVGNVVSMEDAAQSTTYFSGKKVEPVNTYTYDTLYQLIGASGRESLSPASGPDVPAWQPQPGDAIVGFQQTYEYDEGSNLLSLRHTGAQSYTRRMAVASTSNRSMPADDGQSPPDLDEGFDVNGNLRRLQAGRELAWNARNMLLRTTSVSRAEAPDDEERYAYDGTGTRVRKLQTMLVGGQARQRDVRYLPCLEWRSDEITGERLQVICTEIGGGTVRTLHWEDNTVPAGIDNDTDRYAITDHLGSCTFEFDGEATLISHEWYHPYGSTAGCVARSRIEAGYKTVHYSGKERDDSGLHYYGFRYYASWLMRWINPDPAGDAAGLNRFAMVDGNPVTHADVSGLAPSEGEGEAIGRRTAVFDSTLRETFITVVIMGIMLLAAVGAEQVFTGGGQYSITTAAHTLITAGVAVAGWVAGTSLPYPRNTARNAGLAAGAIGAALTASPYLLASTLGSAGEANAAATNMFATTVYAFANEALQQLFGGIGYAVGFGDSPTPLGLIAANTALGGLFYGVSAFAAHYADHRIVDYMLAQPAAAGALMAATSAIAVSAYGATAEITSAGRRVSAVSLRDVLLRGSLRIASQGLGDLLSLIGNWTSTEDYGHFRRFLERFLGNIANEARGAISDRLFRTTSDAEAAEALRSSPARSPVLSPSGATSRFLFHSALSLTPSPVTSPLPGSPETPPSPSGRRHSR